jgi:16S rRNA (cytosine967-C5)-methyltransferase
MFGAEIKVKRYIQDLTCGKKTMAQINEPLTPFEKDLLLGITRHWICLNHALDQYLQKPTQHLDFRLTLIIGIYRLVLTTNPNNKAIIDGIMLLADQWKLAHRKKVIYAILNNILRNPPDLSSFPESTRYSLPLFFYNKMKEELGVYFEASAKSQTQRPQTWAYLFEVNHMSDQMIAPLEEYPQAVQFKDLKNLTEKEGYKAGHWQIQDLAMQKMMSFLPSKIDGIIIDACAAPGGKTIALHKKFPNNPIIAVEIETNKIERLEQNISRCQGENIDIICMDFLKFSGPKEKPCFIWIDAPCSGSGVIGKHPEIKYQVSKQTLISHQMLQKKLLAHAWQMLKPGGFIFYSTCSIFSEENDEVIEFFSKYIQDIKPVKVSMKSKYGITFWMENQFGGYLAIIKKPEKSP